MSDLQAVQRERMTEALVRDLDAAGVVEWIHALQDREAELEDALDRVLDANATREHEGMPREGWDALILATEEALAGEERHGDRSGPTWGEE